MAKIHFLNFSTESNKYNRRQNKKIFVSEYDKSVLKFIDEWNSGKNLWKFHSSGSTGSPKLINAPRTLMEYSARQTNKALGIKENNNLLLGINANFIGGKMMIVRALEANTNLYVRNPSGIDLTEFYGKEIDMAAFVPLQIYSFLKEAKQQSALNQIKNILVGGAPIHDAAVSNIQNMNSIFFQTYGMTETFSHVALKCLNGDKKSSSFKAEREFQWKGRHDHVINSGGIKIFPELLEKKILLASRQLLVEQNFFITSIKDSLLGEKVILYVEGDINKTELISCLKKDIPRYEIPKDIICIPNFTYTLTGKINRIASSKT